MYDILSRVTYLKLFTYQHIGGGVSSTFYYDG